VNISFPDTGLYIIKGRSGAGKTTLMNILSLLDSDYEGEVLFDGKDYRTIKNKELFRFNNFSFVFQ